MPIRGLVFDFDGLILDTEVPSYQAWQEVYRSNGHELPLENWVHVIGTSFGVFDPYLDLQTLTGAAINRQHVEAYTRARTLELLQGMQPMPGVLETIQAAHRLGLRLAVASSSSSAWVLSHLRRLGLEQAFEVIVTRDDVTAVKPDPALFRLAVERMGLPPGDALALEDSLNGILSARAAGLHTVAIPNAITAGLDFRAADLVLPSMCALSLESILNRFA